MVLNEREKSKLCTVRFPIQLLEARHNSLSNKNHTQSGAPITRPQRGSSHPSLVPRQPYTKRHIIRDSEHFAGHNIGHTQLNIYMHVCTIQMYRQRTQVDLSPVSTRYTFHVISCWSKLLCVWVAFFPSNNKYNQFDSKGLWSRT